MELQSKESFESNGWFYGVDNFKDGPKIPWMRLLPTTLIGQEWHWSNVQEKWKVRQKRGTAV